MKAGKSLERRSTIVCIPRAFVGWFGVDAGEPKVSRTTHNPNQPVNHVEFERVLSWNVFALFSLALGQAVRCSASTQRWHNPGWNVDLCCSLSNKKTFRFSHAPRPFQSAALWRTAGHIQLNSNTNIRKQSKGRCSHGNIAKKASLLDLVPWYGHTISMRRRQMLSRTLPTTVSLLLTKQIVEGPITHPPQVRVWFLNFA